MSNAKEVFFRRIVFFPIVTGRAGDITAQSMAPLLWGRAPHEAIPAVFAAILSAPKRKTSVAPVNARINRPARPATMPVAAPLRRAAASFCLKDPSRQKHIFPQHINLLRSKIIISEKSILTQMVANLPPQTLADPPRILAETQIDTDKSATICM